MQTVWSQVRPDKPRGGTLIFHTYVGSGHFFGVKNFESQNFFGFSEKLIYFWGMKILWIFFFGHLKLDYIEGSFLCILGYFLKVKVQNGGYFLGVAKISNIFGGA